MDGGKREMRWGDELSGRSRRQVSTACDSLGGEALLLIALAFYVYVSDGLIAYRYRHDHAPSEVSSLASLPFASEDLDSLRGPDHVREGCYFLYRYSLFPDSFLQ